MTIAPTLDLGLDPPTPTGEPLPDETDAATPEPSDPATDHPIGTVRSGWCMTRDHDTASGRGGCPIQVSNQAACPCECHHGATAPRGYLPLPERTPAGI